jgi:hypothetical protein
MSEDRSPGRATARLKFLVGLVTRRIQPAGEDVSIDSLVPLVCQKPIDSPREALQLLSREVGNGELKFFDAHDRLAYRGKCGDHKTTRAPKTTHERSQPPSDRSDQIRRPAPQTGLAAPIPAAPSPHAPSSETRGHVSSWLVSRPPPPKDSP